MEHSYSQGLMEMRESGAMEISPGAAAEVPGDVYTCPLVMDDSCTIGPIGEIEFFSILFLFQRIAHTAIWEVLGTHLFLFLRRI